MANKLLVSLIGVVLAAGVSGCGDEGGQTASEAGRENAFDPNDPGEFPVSVDEIGQAVGFDQFIGYEFDYADVRTRGGEFREGEATAIIALFWKAGVLGIRAKETSPPYYTLEVNQPATYQGRVVRLPIGRRVVTRVDNFKQWKEGPVDLAGATVHYQVEVMPAVARLVTGMTFDFSYRAVVENDPAVGSWELRSGSRGTTFETRDEYRTVILQLQSASEALELKKELLKEVALRKKEAADKIEAQLAASGQLKFSSDKREPNVLLSPRHRLAYYRGHKFWRNVSLRQLMAHCSGAVDGGDYAWRIPSPEELKLVINDDTLVDAPDGRLWGAIGRSPYEVSYFPTSKVTVNGEAFDLYDLPSGMRDPTLRVYYLQNDRDFRPNGWGIPGAWRGSYLDQDLSGGNSDRQWRVICVADLKS